MQIKAVRHTPSDDAEQKSREGILSPFREAGQDVWWHMLKQVGQPGAHDVQLADVAGTAAGPEEHRSVLTVEGAVTVSRVLQGRADYIESQQLNRIN